MTMTVPPQADWGQAMTAQELRRIFDEIAQQPPWRAQADREADYADGNQLDSDLLAAMRRSGIPPAKENVIGPAIATLCGHEAKTRTDWRVTPDGDTGGQDVADALNYRLNQAERNSRADDAMSEAFRSQVAVGLGWWRWRAPVIRLPFPCAAAVCIATRFTGRWGARRICRIAPGCCASVLSGVSRRPPLSRRIRI